MYLASTPRERNKFRYSILRSLRLCEKNVGWCVAFFFSLSSSGNTKIKGIVGFYVYQRLSAFEKGGRVVLFFP